MKKQLTIATLAGLLVASSAFAQEGLTDTRGEAIRDSWGDCIVTLDGANACSPQIHNVALEADAFFDFDKAVLKPEGKAKLDQLVADIGQAKEVKGIIIAGHTDGIGAEEYNQRLSERRANAVAEYLTSRGVSPQLVETKGFGKRYPVVPNDTPANRAKNRRVEVVIKASQYVNAQGEVPEYLKDM